MRYLLKLWYKIIGKTPGDMEMVQYWKTKEACAAKLTKGKDGSIIMYLEGEKYPFPSFPRSYLLFGKLSKLKHEIKNQIFNESWHELEDGVERKQVIKNIKRKLFGEIAEIAKQFHYDMLPPKSMTPSVREIHRAWTKVAPQHSVLRDYLCFILQEDDGYRMRLQWLAWYKPLIGLFVKHPKWFDKSLQMLEHAEVINDMKERIRLLRRILNLALEDDNIRELFTNLFKEIDWKKVKLTKGEKYHFRGKYFKVDYPVLEY